MAFFTASYHQLVSKHHQGFRRPLRPCVAFPTTSFLRRLWSPTVWLPVLTELYNSSTATQSPTQSLEWYVWSSSSGNNCHAVHRSLSSGASVYECTMGILPYPILLAKSTYAISLHKCHRNESLPSGASLWNGIFGRVEGQNTTHFHFLFHSCFHVFKFIHSPLLLSFLSSFLRCFPFFHYYFFFLPFDFLCTFLPSFFLTTFNL